VTYDLAYGGNFYAILPLDQFGLPFDRSRKDDILKSALSLMEAINTEDEPVHPEDPSIHGCHHVHLYAPGSTARHSRHAMAIHPGWFDRSPCGTGTSARMAQLHARGELPLNTEFVNESFIGTRFTGRLLATTEVAGRPAVLPSFTGRAWITGTAQYLLDPADPFPAGFVL
jgi:proline racemase